MVRIVFEGHFQCHGQAVEPLRERIATDSQVRFSGRIGRITVLRLERAIR